MQNMLFLLTSAYADDIQITTSKPEYNQKLLNYVDKFLNWSRTREVKPLKCCTLAMKKFDHLYINKSLTPHSNPRYSHSHYDPNLFLSGEHITSITDEVFKCLGVRIEWTLQENLINLVNSTQLYNHHIVPRLSWWFTTLKLSLSFAEHLHSLVLPFLKKWCGLPRAANPSILFCGSKSRPGLRLKRIPTVWKQSRASMLQLLKYSRDTRVRSLFFFDVGVCLELSFPVFCVTGFPL